MDSKPRILERVTPDYPPLALRERRAAKVYVGVLVDSEGRVRQTIVSKSNGTGYGFDEAAVQAALQTVYEPARHDGEPVEFWSELIFDFQPPPKP
jgi:protein TonB